MKKMLLFVAAPVLVLGIAAAAFFLVFSGGEGPDEAALAKEPGPVYTMTDPFVVNLADRQTPRLAKVGVALQVSKLSADLVPEGAEGVKIAQDAQIRDIVLTALQKRTAANLATVPGRRAVKNEIIAQVNRRTDLRIIDVYYTDFAVQ